MHQVYIVGTPAGLILVGNSGQASTCPDKIRLELLHFSPLRKYRIIHIQRIQPRVILKIINMMVCLFHLHSLFLHILYLS